MTHAPETVAINRLQKSEKTKDSIVRISPRIDDASTVSRFFYLLAFFLAFLAIFIDVSVLLIVVYDVTAHNMVTTYPTVPLKTRP